MQKQLILLFCLLQFGCFNYLFAQNNPSIKFTIISAPNNTWGYDIYKDEKLFIHQPTVPGVPGNEAFKTKAQATTIAQLVITKIKKGEMPPVVSKSELDSLLGIKLKK